MISTNNPPILLDDFLDAPEYKRKTIIKPSPMRRWVYTLVLFAAMLMAIIGVMNVFLVLTRTSQTATETGLLGAGLIFLVVAGTLLLRFAKPAAFSMLISPEFFGWSTLLGWHAANWDEIEYVLIRPHARYGTREVFMKAGDARLRFGWSHADQTDLTGPLESLPAQQAKSLLHTLVRRAELERREAGVWVKRGIKPASVKTGMLPW